MGTFLLFSVIFLLILLYIYKWATKNKNYFIDRNIPAMKPMIFLGNTAKMIFRQWAPPVMVSYIYNLFPNEPVVGFFDRHLPVHLIRDPELIKLLTVKEFDHFLNHRLNIDPQAEPIFGKSLFGLEGQAWKEMRSTLSPAFTGSKMRSMFELVCKCGDTMAKYCQENEKNKIIETKEFFSRFSTDVIATCAFGIEVNSLKDRNNSFYEMGKNMMKFDSLAGAFRIMIFLLCPGLARTFNIPFFDRKTTTNFHSIILKTMKKREENNILRPDMINLLMIARKGHSLESHEKEDESKEFSVVEEHLQSTIKKDWTDIDVTAQCFLFFFAGFDTISSTMSFMAYELALNPDIQDKLIEEIDSINDELDGKSLTYNKLQEMKYMDMVVSEALRKWPPFPSTDRCCTSEVSVNYENKTLNFIKGDLLFIPIFPIHRDPKFYPNPERFDPERFSDERKHEINPSAYLPFGVGPRNCIGSRFALMEAKAAFYSILKYFKFEICEETEPFEYGRKNFRVLPDNGIKLRLKSRSM